MKRQPVIPRPLSSRIRVARTKLFPVGVFLCALWCVIVVWSGYFIPANRDPSGKGSVVVVNPQPPRERDTNNVFAAAGGSASRNVPENDDLPHGRGSSRN